MKWEWRLLVESGFWKIVKSLIKFGHPESFSSSIMRRVNQLSARFPTLIISAGHLICLLARPLQKSAPFSSKKKRKEGKKEANKLSSIPFYHLYIFPLFCRLWFFIAITFLDGPKSCSSFLWNTDLNVGWMKTLGKFILLLVFRLESVLVCALVSSFLNSSLKILLELEKRFDLLFSALLWLFSLSSIAEAK